MTGLRPEDEAARFEAFTRYRRAGVRYRLARRVATEVRAIDPWDRAEMDEALNHAREELVSEFCAMVGAGLINGAERGLLELLKAGE